MPPHSYFFPVSVWGMNCFPSFSRAKASIAPAFSRPHYFSYEIPRIPPNLSKVFIECPPCPILLITFQDNQSLSCLFQILILRKLIGLQRCTALAEDLSLVPITKDPMLWVPAVTCTHIFIPTHKHTTKSAIYFKKKRKLIPCQTLWPWCSLSHCECDFGLWSYLVFIFQMTNHRSWFIFIFIVKNMIFSTCMYCKGILQNLPLSSAWFQ